MSTLADNLASDIAAALALTGETLAYTDADGNATELTGQFSPERPDLREVADGRAAVVRATAIVAAADAASPAHGEAVTRAGVEWAIVTAEAIAGGAYWRLALQRSAVEERSREGYRLTR